MNPRTGVAPVRTLRAAPLRVRLVAGFALVMSAVLAAAGSFVYWRVQVDLDQTLDSTLSAQAIELRHALQANPGRPGEALSGLSVDTRTAISQVLDGSGRVLAKTVDAPQESLLRHEESLTTRYPQTEYNLGELLGPARRRLRVLAYLTASDQRGQKSFVATAVPLGQRDEALRELLAQLAFANLAALALASAVGYRLTRAALLPVERYRSQAEQVTGGATGIRLDVPDGADDEISRLGHTLNRMLSAQERAGAAQRQFLADASHELRTPLAILSGEVELALRRPRTNAELERTLREVAADAHRLTQLANQLLELEHSNSIRRPGPSAPSVAVDPAVQRALLRGRALLQDGGRVVQARLAPDVGAAATNSQLDQILGNLVDNAVLHGAGDIYLEADRVVTQSGVPTVRLTVHDEGPGIAPAFVPHAIDRFRREDPARNGVGSGLGLSLVHSITRSLGGEVRMCTRRQHHTYPPELHAGVPCHHPPLGVTLTVVLPG